MLPIAVERWERIARTRDFQQIDDLLAEDVVFESPIVHVPQIGRAVTRTYLIAAVKVLDGPDARFVSRWFGDNSAVLELETIVDRVRVNAVDIVSWNDENRIIQFKVMVRPLKAVNAVHQAMGEILRHAES